VNRVAVHQSVLSSHDPVAGVSAARAAGVDSIGFHVASIASVEALWDKGAGSAALATVVDALLVSRVTALDVGRVDLAPGADPTDVSSPQYRVLDLGSRLGCQFVTVRTTEGGAEESRARFAELAEAAARRGVRPLLVPDPGTAAGDARDAAEIVRGTRGGVVLDVRPRGADRDEVADLIAELGDALGYVRVAAGELDADMGPATSLLATLPPQVPLVIGSPVGGADDAPRPVDDVAFLTACRAGLDRLLIHPRAVAAEREGRTG
jgi:sugar phosphate isomerase/epimerase